MPELYNFSAPTIPTQNASEAFGVNTINTCRVTSSFTIASSMSAYSMLPGVVLLQQQSGGGAFDNRVNLILKPDQVKGIKLPIKYIIYRGLDINNFLTSNAVADPGTDVKTTGLGILEEMKLIQDVRAPSDPITVEALFGDELAPATTKKIEEFFFKKVPISSQLFHLDGGIEIGKFASGDGGIDIIIENPEYSPDVEMAKSPIYQIDATGITNPADLKGMKDRIRHFVDPAAFYGLHIDLPGGIEYRSTGGTNGTKVTASNKMDIYNNVILPFATKNTVYLDIRNENGYSYNYYDNYVGSGLNANKELKLGSNTGSLSFKEYYSNGWPLRIVDTITPHATDQENEFFVKLRVNDNERPLVASDISEIFPFVVEDDGTFFIDETELLTIPIPATLPDFTEEFSVKVPNLPGGTPAQPATLVKLEYFKQNLPINSSNKFPVINFSDYLFGPLNITVPFDSTSSVQWISNFHRTFVDSLNDGYAIGQLKTGILGFPTTSQIEIFGEIPVNVDTEAIIENDNGTTTNEGTFKILNTTISGGMTIIEIDGVVPGPLQLGDNVLFSVRVEGEMDFGNNALIIKSENYSSLGAFALGEKIDFYSKYSFANTYTISSNVFTTPDTIITFSEQTEKSGFAGIMETGIILESDLATGSPTDDDRLMYYAAPTGYFKSRKVKRSFSFANRGGTSEIQSMLQALEKIMPKVKISPTTLKPTITTDILSFAYDTDSKAKEMLFLLGVTKTEFQGMPVIGFNSAHQILMRLESIGRRKTDTEGNLYYEYEIKLTGLDGALNFLEVSTGVIVYSTDNLIFTSDAFTARYGIDVTLVAQSVNDFLTNYDFTGLTNYTFEEFNMLDQTQTNGPRNKILLEKDPTMVLKISDFKTALDNVTHNKSAIIALLEQSGADLFAHAKQRIKMIGEFWTNKDGILYIARLRMQVIMKNHPTIMGKFSSNIRKFYNILELHSRGLAGTEKPNFSSTPPGVKKILITGFDPFDVGTGLGTDWQNEVSNPSGNIVLAMGDRDIYDGVNPYVGSTVKAEVKCAIFPVRWEDFDKGLPVSGNSKGIAEDFFESYFSGANKPDMIITYSYGVHYTNAIDHDFHLERFAANWQSYGDDNNGTENYDRSARANANTPAIIKVLNSSKKDWTFIESTLPFEKLEDTLNPGHIKVPNYHVVVNHGPKPKSPSDYDWNNGIHWDIFGTNNMNVENKANIFADSLTGGEPSIYFPDKPFPPAINSKATFNASKETNDSVFYSRFLVCDNTEIKYFFPVDYTPGRTINDQFIPLPTWDNYKIPAIDSAFPNGVRIEARNGSGGTYMSNLIYYRVAYLRMKHNNNIPTGHVHMGFNDGGTYDRHGSIPGNRDGMLADVAFMIQRFNDIPTI